MTLPPGAQCARQLGGGNLNEAYRVTLASGVEAFVKTRANAAPGEYAGEAAGLHWLAEPRALRTPRVLECSEGYLALEWIEPGRMDRAGAEELGRGLALTHAAGAPCFGDPAPGRAAGFGHVRLSNEPAADWAGFYAQRRLLALARMARERGALAPTGLTAVERVCERLHELTGPPEPPARLHGDLWSGNVMAGQDGRPWLVDPAAYGGHREVDLAMLRLFGSPSERVFHAYEELAPLASGWQERIELYQLAPVLVHALLFGGSYVAGAERIARRYAA